ncbi:MAG: hypothetical protein JXA96_05090 [Sedimentisphaerales bacterium]|nr:hypothetical protein [Sedimentisphaerales bacterium]
MRRNLKYSNKIARSANEKHPLELEYIIRELEIHSTYANHTRQRSEEIGHFYLTALTATIGGILIVIQSSENVLFRSCALFLGSWALFGFSSFTFFRVCSFQSYFTWIRLRSIFLRQAVYNYGIKVANYLQPIKRNVISGFSPNILWYLTILSLFSSIIFSVIVISGIAVLRQLFSQPIFQSSFFFYKIYLIPGIISFFALISLYLTILHKFKKKSNVITEQYLSEHNINITI